MSIERIIELLERDTTHLDSYSYEDADMNLGVRPLEYLEFAEEDIKNKNKKGIINALSNAKRSLDCQIESLLYSFCLSSYAKREKLNLPQKIELLNQIGVIAPRILKKINKTRNMMEHDFYCPSREEVEDYIDVVLLFNTYTNKYLFNVPSHCYAVDDTDRQFGFAPVFDRKNQLINMYIKYSENNMVKNSTAEEIEFDFIASKENINKYISYIKLHNKTFGVQ